MSDILGYFAADTKKATVTRPTYTKVNGKMIPGDYTAIGTYDVLYWKGSMAEAFVSEKFKAQTDAAISVDTSANIKRMDKVTVNSIEYQVIDVDDVGLAGEHKHVALKVP